MQKLKPLFIRHWPLLVLLAFFGWLFFSLLSSHMLYPKADGWYSGGSAWGDLAFHLNIITSFRERGFTATLYENPIFYGAPLAYPFAADYLSALLAETGLSLRSALILPSLVFLLVLAALIYFLTLKMTRSKAGALIGLFIFFFNGSIFGLWPFWRDWQESGLGFQEFLGAMTRQYAYVPELNIHFSNVLADFMLAQRTFIFGLAVGLVALFLLWSYWVRGGRLKLLYAGLVTAVLPSVHAHSFMTVSMVGGFLFLVSLYREPKNWKKFIADWLHFFLPVAALGLPQMVLLFLRGRESFLHFRFGWLKGDRSFIWFWVKNLSPHIFIFIWAWFRARSEVRSFYLAFWGVFGVANIIVFQPYDFDNSKMFIWWYLIGAIVAAGLVGDILSKISVPRLALASVIFVTMTVVGVLSVWREYNLSWLLFPSEDIELAGFIKANTPKDALFMTLDEHKNPVPALAGRRVVMGYRGWLWSHGIDYRARESDVLKMYAGGEESLALFKKYGIGYVLTENGKVGELEMNTEFFARNFPMIYKTSSYALFKVD